MCGNVENSLLLLNYICTCFLKIFYLAPHQSYNYEEAFTITHYGALLCCR